MYSVLFKLRRDPTIPVIRTYFSSLKENILPSIAVELIVIVLGILAYGDATFALAQTGTAQFVFLTVATIVGVVALILLTYGTSQIANFKNTVKNYLKNSFVLALVAPGWMVLVWLVWIAVLGILAVFPEFVLRYLGWAYFMWGLSFPAFLSTMIFAKVFKRFEDDPVSEPSSPQSGSDEELASEDEEPFAMPYRQPDEDPDEAEDSQPEDIPDDESDDQESDLTDESPEDSSDQA